MPGKLQSTEQVLLINHARNNGTQEANSMRIGRSRNLTNRVKGTMRGEIRTYLSLYIERLRNSLWKDYAGLKLFK